jgi:hypothetical protein
MKAIFYTALPVLAGFIFFSVACEQKDIMHENKAEIKFVTAIPGGCNDKEALRADDQPDKDTVIISTIADTIHVFVGHNYSCGAPFKTGKEMEDACQVPADVLKNMSTQAVIQAIWEYPFFMDVKRLCQVRTCSVLSQDLFSNKS